MSETDVGIRPHRRRSFVGRDPDEVHRSATPLELLYDLTFVVAFGTAANELAKYVAAGKFGTAILGFTLASFAVAWAWINYSWFASAYDTDDWIMRIATMVQMVGVIILALGLQPLFASIDQGGHVNNTVTVAGYIVLRVPMIGLWARAARDDPPHRPAALTYIWTIAVAQVFWVVLAIVSLPIEATLALFVLFAGVEMIGPVVAERRKGGTPWHARHIAERYGLLVIITLGEGIIGTVASINAVVHGDAGWTIEAGVVGFAGVGLIFATWWTYFVIPWADVLSAHRERSFLWGYGHIVVFASLAALGGGLHVAAYYLEHQTTLGPVGTVLSTAIPFAIYIGTLYALYATFTRHADPFHLALFAGTLAVLVLSVALAALGVSVAGCLVVLTFAPIVTVVGYETVGHRHVAAALDEVRGSPA